MAEKFKSLLMNAICENADVKEYKLLPFRTEGYPKY